MTAGTATATATASRSLATERPQSAGPEARSPEISDFWLAAENRRFSATAQYRVPTPPPAGGDGRRPRGVHRFAAGGGANQSPLRRRHQKSEISDWQTRAELSSTTRARGSRERSEWDHEGVLREALRASRHDERASLSRTTSLPRRTNDRTGVSRLGWLWPRCEAVRSRVALGTPRCCSRSLSTPEPKPTTTEKRRSARDYVPCCHEDMYSTCSSVSPSCSTPSAASLIWATSLSSSSGTSWTPAS